VGSSGAHHESAFPVASEVSRPELGLLAERRHGMCIWIPTRQGAEPVRVPVCAALEVRAAVKVEAPWALPAGVARARVTCETGVVV
jgi:hypothetical protein